MASVKKRTKTARSIVYAREERISSSFYLPALPTSFPITFCLPSRNTLSPVSNRLSGIIGPTALPLPFLGKRDLRDRIFGGYFDVVEEIFRTQPRRQLMRRVAVGIDHLVRPIAHEEFRLDILVRLGNDAHRPQLLDQRGDLQRSLEILDRHDHGVEVVDAEVLEDFGIHAVADVRVLKYGGKRVDAFLALVHDENVVPLVVQLAGELGAEIAQTDH